MESPPSPPRPPRVYICAQPKSGSTHMMASLVRYFEGMVLCGANYYLDKGIESQDIHPPLMRAQLEQLRSVVYKQHHLPTPNNLEVLRSAEYLYGLRTIVTVRDVADAVWSMKGHFERGLQKGVGPDKYFAMPIGYPIEKNRYRAMEEWERRELLCALYGPWMYMFQAGWRTQSQLNALLVRYEEMWEDPVGEFRQVVEFVAGEEAWDEEKGRKALDVRDRMWDRGTPGRGEEIRCKLQAVGEALLQYERAPLELPLPADRS